MKKFVFVIFTLASLQAMAQPDRIVGVWVTPEKDARIHIFKNGSRYYAKMIWLTPSVDDKGNALTDTQNPDATKRTRKLEGLEIITDLEYADKKWKGSIYDPESGQTYSAQLRLLDEKKLELNGYVGIPLFGRKEIWTKLAGE